LLETFLKHHEGILLFGCRFWHRMQEASIRGAADRRHLIRTRGAPPLRGAIPARQADLKTSPIQIVRERHQGHV